MKAIVGREKLYGVVISYHKVPLMTFRELTAEQVDKIKSCVNGLYSVWVEEHSEEYFSMKAAYEKYDH